MREQEELNKIFSVNIRNILKKSGVDFGQAEEIRMRVDQPLILMCQGREYFLSPSGELSREEEKGYRVSKKELMETMEYAAKYSMYAYEEELKQGFLTIQGGHRIGVAGKIVMDGEKIRSMKYISFLNVRISHQVKGCADLVAPYVAREGEICHTLIISPPRCGKTTLLRDLIRQISNGNAYTKGCTVGVVDERSELGGAYLGIPQNDLGIRTDVLDCCPKAAGMMMLIRAMSPKVIAVDEIGDYGDIHAIEAVVNCGCKLLATVHGSSIEDIERKPLFQKLIQERVFERYVLLGNQGGLGRVQKIFDERGSSLYERGKGQC